MELNELKRDLDMLITHIQMRFENMLYAQKEYIIFNEDDLEHDTPDDYLEMRNDLDGSVFDVHPLKVTKEGILVVEADGSFKRHLIQLHQLGSVLDRINIIELMEINLDI